MALAITADINLVPSSYTYIQRKSKVAVGRLSLFLFAFDVNKPHRVIPKRGRVAARVWVALAICENCQPV